MKSMNILARQLAIVGHPPRIEPLASSEITDEQRAQIVALWQAIGIPPRDDVPEFFGTMLRHPQLMMRQTEYATQLLRSELSPRHRQLAILRIGWLCQAPYEWSQHVKNGKMNAGLSDRDVQRLTEGASAVGWDEDDRAVVKAVEEMYEVAMISDSTWSSLTGFLNEKQLLELPLLVGYYQSVAYLQNSVRFRLMPGSQGLMAR